MKALILAAGLGTRLQPLTHTIPKALVPVAGKPMIRHLIERLAEHGVSDFVVNLYHHAGRLNDYLLSVDIPGVTIQCSDEKETLLETGGALKRAASFFCDGKPFLVHNVDVWTNLDPNLLLKNHLQTGALVTLAVRNRMSSRYFLFDDAMQLCGWENRKKGEKILLKEGLEDITPLAFSGIQIIDPAIFSFFPPEDRFSLVSFYLSSVPSSGIRGYIHDDEYWYDLGTPENIARVEAFSG